MEPTVYRVRSWGSPVGAGALDSVYCSLDAVAKQNPARLPFSLANEFICGRLAAILGLPTPPCLVVEGQDGNPAFLSLRFGTLQGRPPNGSSVELVNDEPRLAASIVAFDFLVGNDDRHEGNFAYSSGNVAPTIFDHSHALIGDRMDTSKLGAQDALINNNAISPHITSGSDLEDAVNEIQAVPPHAMQRICVEAVAAKVLPTGDWPAVYQFLIYRQGHLLDLLKRDAHLNQNVNWTLSS